MRPRFWRQSLLALASLACLAGFILPGCDDAGLPEIAQTISPGASTASPGGAHDYLFCAWNVENLFDDQNDRRTGLGDKEYDGWLSSQPDMLRLKLTKLTDALLQMNQGKGPDILAVVEVESVRAAELLQQALNARLTDPALHYRNVLMKEVSSGRHIAPAIITRLPVVRDRTRLLASRQRILQGHVVVNGRELIVLASHWTSRLREENEKGRLDYADKLYGAASAIYRSNPEADFLICGDFNDTPQDVSVRDRLRAGTGFGPVSTGAPQLQLLNLMVDKDPAICGTHNYNGRWYIFDQIVVSPGMLDGAGWSCDPASTQTVKLSRPGDRNQRPWRFGGEKETAPRGYSDHFPVTVRLRVMPSSR
jgi:endonuclease/exonuclease/phosphatase family metal-dependent hydrolase